MSKYTVEVKEILAKYVTVEATSPEDAVDIVKDLYKKEEIVLDDTDFVENFFNIEQ